MAQEPISQNDVALGRVILLATDSIRMDCEGAFWLYDEDEQDWRFYLVTSLLATIGPRELYLVLNEALARKVSPDECANIGIHIASPKDYLVTEMAEIIHTDSHSTFPRAITFDNDGIETSAVVYRLAPHLSDSATRST